MNLSTQVKPISYLKAHAADVVRDVSSGGEPLLITQNGVGKLVVMDVAVYEAREETLAMLKLLALGAREVAHGDFRDADAVFSTLEADDSA